MWQILSPFTARLWGVIVSATAFFAVASVLAGEMLSVNKTPQPCNTRERCAHVGERFYQTWSALLGGSEKFDETTLPSRILRLSLLFFGAAISATYTANLAAFLTLSGTR